MKNCKKPGVKGEYHSITNISNYYRQRFADRIKIMPNGCHFLVGNAINTGYVNWWYRYEDADGETRVRYISAHRFSALTSGKFKEADVNEYCVMHDCDQNYEDDDVSYRQCVNPDHLLLGTVQDNALDCVRKGRHRNGDPRPGELNSNSKLTRSQAQFIIDNHYIITQKELAKQMNISVSTVEAIHRVKTWKHLAR